MLVALKFRHRIGLLVVLVATALVTVTAVALVLGSRGEQQLAGIETLYVPLIELDRDLKTRFADIPRALEDAVTAAEDSRLADADKLYADVIARVRAGRRSITANGHDPLGLEIEIAGYYTEAREVAAALVGGATPGQLGLKITVMRHRAQAVGTLLDAATTPDRQRLAAAFTTARAAQRDAIWIDFVVATSALVLIGLLSWRIIRDTVHALRAVGIGVERLARGEFGHEIAVTTRDELGDLAREANRTAVRLREYREQAERDAEALRDAAATLETRNATLVAAQQLLEERAEELARASRYKSEFLANMSHELRTPLNSIMILSRVLAENQDRSTGGGMTDRQVEFATLIHKSGEELLALINEVLDLAKIEAGKQELACESLALGDLEDYVRRMFEPLAAQKQLGFEVELAGELPVAIRTDRARLAQIVKNLIANAFKFTERGKVCVRMFRAPDARTRGGDRAPIVDPLVIAVSDTGIGIAPDKQAWIFEAFAQADTGISRKFGGTGLGLTIAKQLATRLGGDLTVDSTLGAGSTFSAVLPIGGTPDTDDARRPVASGTLPPRSVDDRPGRTTAVPFLLGALDARDPEPVLDGKTVLIVDDDMRNVYLLSNALSAQRLHVITAADGQEALDELDRNPGLDIVLLDSVMPRMDGLEALARVRGQPRFRALPIIMLTAQTMPGHRDRCLAAGANDYLAKPVDLGQLLDVLRSWLA
ncbi:MAG TPA: response regulator [Kofleriaceae bacterium]